MAYINTHNTVLLFKTTSLRTHHPRLMPATSPVTVVVLGALSCLFLTTDGVALLALLARTYDECQGTLSTPMQLCAPLALAYGLSRLSRG